MTALRFSFVRRPCLFDPGYRFSPVFVSTFDSSHLIAMAAASTSRRSAKELDMTGVEFETSEDVDVVSSFDSMNLREDLVRGIYAYGTYRLQSSGAMSR